MLALQELKTLLQKLSSEVDRESSVVLGAVRQFDKQISLTLLNIYVNRLIVNCVGTGDRARGAVSLRSCKVVATPILACVFLNY
jgi:hypothetical protein